ncbi:hypothetical protein KCMC57_up05400 [Kitasatospora sp. CMC57]
MRSARTLLTGAALAATVLLAAPAAYAEDGATELTWEQKQAKAATTEGQKTWEEKQATGKPDGSATQDEATTEYKQPKGGVQAGGGGTALSGGGLAVGAVLLAGGLGVGAHLLRRRPGVTGTA